MVCETRVFQKCKMPESCFSLYDNPQRAHNNKHFVYSSKLRVVENLPFGLNLQTAHSLYFQVTMGQLTSFLLPKGYTLPIVPELDDLTVGRRLESFLGSNCRRKHFL